MRRNKRNRLTEGELGDAVYAALRRTGAVVPTNEETVAAAELWVAIDGPPLPAELLDVPRVLATRHPDSWPTGLIRPWDSSSMDATLARAAREGGTLSPEIEEVMRRDREIAQAELESKRVRSRREGTAGDGD